MLRRSRLYLLLFLLGLPLMSLGQSSEIDTHSEQPETVQPTQPRSFSADKIAEYLVDDDFDYPERGKAKVNVWSRFWRWFWDLFPNISIDEDWSTILRIGFYILCGIAVIYAVLRLLGLENSPLLGRRSSGQVHYAGMVEDIHSINFEEEINQAVQQQNYQQAIRWCYLWGLKKLSDDQLIDWHPGKTDHEYLAEINDLGLRKRLSYLVYLHEYTWYGDFPADEELFNDAQQRVYRLTTQPA